MENLRVRDFSKEVDFIQIVLIYLLSLITPLFLEKILSNYIANSQLIVGTIVNTLFVITAFNITGNKKILGIITMPSIATILSGYIFKGPQISFMIMMMPAIWLGNFAFVYLIKKLYLKNKVNYFLSGLLSALAKSLIIAGYFLIISSFVTMPKMVFVSLRTAMCINQFITASLSIIASYAILKIELKKD